MAEVARDPLRPALDALSVPGYAETAANRGEFLADGMYPTTKPFAVQTLALKVGEMIGP